MATYRAQITVMLSIPNKLKANGQPAGNAVWHSINIPAGSLFTFNGATGWLTDLLIATPVLVRLI